MNSRGGSQVYLEVHLLPSPWIPHFHHLFDPPSGPPGISTLTWMSSPPVKHEGLSRQDTPARGDTQRLGKAEAETMRTRDNSSRNEEQTHKGTPNLRREGLREEPFCLFTLLCVPVIRKWIVGKCKSCWVLRRPLTPLHKSSQGPYFTSCGKAFTLIWDKIGALSQLSQIIPTEKN